MENESEEKREREREQDISVFTFNLSLKFLAGASRKPSSGTQTWNAKYTNSGNYKSKDLGNKRVSCTLSSAIKAPQIMLSSVDLYKIVCGKVIYAGHPLKTIHWWGITNWENDFLCVKRNTIGWFPSVLCSCVIMQGQGHSACLDRKWSPWSRV